MACVQSGIAAHTSELFLSRLWNPLHTQQNIVRSATLVVPPPFGEQPGKPISSAASRDTLRELMGWKARPGID